MSEQELRLMIAEALEYASVIAMQHKGLTAVFLDGGTDIPLEDLEMDSLATMELCIAIETNTGVSIVPDDLVRLGTLNRLVEALRESL